MVLDAVRGLALFGILVVNAPLFFWPVQYLIVEGIPGSSLLDDGANVLVRYVFEGKFFTIFSLLFGIGVALQLSRGHRPRTLLRRLLLLAVFGALHVTVFWWGDILLHYAIFGVALVLARRWPPRRLLRAAVVFLAVPVVLQVGLASLNSFVVLSPDEAVALDEAAAASEATLAAQAASALEVFGGRDVAAAAALRWSTWAFNTVGNLFGGLLLIVLAMFFVGAAAQRSGWIEPSSAPRWRRLFVRVLPVAIVANAVYAWGALSGSLYDFGTWPAAIASIGFVVGAPSGALAIATGAALLLRGGGVTASALGAVGRQALSVYLAQSLVMTTLAYGYGLGLYGAVSHAQAFGIAVVLFAVQVVVAVLYARRRRYGPAEWLWRAGTYGRVPS